MSSTRRDDVSPADDETAGSPAVVSAERRGLRWVGLTLVAVAVLAALLAAASWQLTGGRWEVVSTPSMGRVAPVGSLVLTRPVAATDLAVGDVVSYRSPGQPGRDTVTHRIVSVDPAAPDGPTFRTRGDINGADDPVLLRGPDIVGRVVAIGWGVGWLVKALPLLLAALVVTWGATWLWVTPLWRVPLRVLAASLSLSTATWLLKPFVGVVSLGSSADASGSHMTLVSTGMLPIRVSAATGGSVDLVDGQVGVLTTQITGDAKGAVLTSGVHMPFWLWGLMGAVWLLPLAYGLVSAWRNPPTFDESAGDDPTDDDGGAGGDAAPATGDTASATDDTAPRRARAGVVATSLAAVLGVVLTSTATTAAFTARVTNSVDTAASAAYFTCLGAQTAPPTAAPSFVWPLDDASLANGSTARDVEGNNRTGVYTGPFTANTTTPRACPRDTGTRAVNLVPTSTNQSYIPPTNTTATNAVNVFSVEIWFKTSTATGGRLIGWGNARTGTSTAIDRVLYMASSGALVFGVNAGGTARAITTSSAYNDGQWHQAVGTLSAAGLALYVDGALAPATTANPNTTVTAASAGTGFWRVGADSLANVPSRPATDYWTGTLAWAAVYSGVALTPTQVEQMFVAGS